jgi:hypothetical protein
MPQVEYNCARCGSSLDFDECGNCDDGFVGHDCGEDCCCCADPYDNVACDICHGTGSLPHCLASREWCEANPLPGREKVKRSTPEAFTVGPRKRGKHAEEASKAGQERSTPTEP